MSFSLRLLRIDLSNQNVSTEEIQEDISRKFIGGRGMAAKILWDELDAGADPLGPENKLILATGPLTGLPIPSSGKLVLAGKSPSTQSYGDGNVGTLAGIHLRRSGYDIAVIEGMAERPTHIHITEQGVEFHDASEIWGLDTFEKEDRLSEFLGSGNGKLVIGPGGENLVKYATVMSRKGRSGGRCGMGAVMGSKKLAAITMEGSGDLPIDDEKALRNLTSDAYSAVTEKPEYDFWTRQGTMQVIRWCQLNSTLPTKNFSEGVFDQADTVDGYSMERHKVDRRGCPNCNMQCGNVISSSAEGDVELDYENVAMLGPNLGISDIQNVGTLNLLCDRLGLDTISTGSSIGFAMEASQKGLLSRQLDFGDFEQTKDLIEDIAARRDLGDRLAEGTKKFAADLGGDAEDWAMQIKGLEISAYDCHTLPGMALAYSTSCIGAHHKDSWLISWEVKHDRSGYGDGKIEELIDQQRKRGGAFEFFTTCRLPWIELGFDLGWYEKFFQAATGEDMGWEEFDRTADRTYSLIRSFLVRERGKAWTHQEDVPPSRWFEDPLTEGPHAGKALDRGQYLDMLGRYYEKRGWNENGVPTAETLEDLDLPEVEVS